MPRFVRLELVLRNSEPQTVWLNADAVVLVTQVRKGETSISLRDNMPILVHGELEDVVTRLRGGGEPLSEEGIK